MCVALSYSGLPLPRENRRSAPYASFSERPSRSIKMPWACAITSRVRSAPWNRIDRSSSFKLASASLSSDDAWAANAAASSWSRTEKADGVSE